MALASIVQIAKSLGLSESRLRAVLRKEGSPSPVIPSKNVGGGKEPGKYDSIEVTKFYKQTRYKRKEERW